MTTYRDYNVNQKINAKANTIVFFGKQNVPLMRQVKKNFIVSDGSKLNLRDESQNNNRNYDGPDEPDYDFEPCWSQHRMIEAQKLK